MFKFTWMMCHHSLGHHENLRKVGALLFPHVVREFFVEQRRRTHAIMKSEWGLGDNGLYLGRKLGATPSNLQHNECEVDEVRLLRVLGANQSFGRSSGRKQEATMLTPHAYDLASALSVRRLIGYRRWPYHHFVCCSPISRSRYSQLGGHLKPPKRPRSDAFGCPYVDGWIWTTTMCVKDHNECIKPFII